jgi:hypothetical protein
MTALPAIASRVDNIVDQHQKTIARIVEGIANQLFQARTDVRLAKNPEAEQRILERLHEEAKAAIESIEQSTERAKKQMFDPTGEKEPYLAALEALSASDTGGTRTIPSRENVIRALLQAKEWLESSGTTDSAPNDDAEEGIATDNHDIVEQKFKNLPEIRLPGATKGLSIISFSPENPDEFKALAKQAKDRPYAIFVPSQNVLVYFSQYPGRLAKGFISKNSNDIYDKILIPLLTKLATRGLTEVHNIRVRNRNGRRAQAAYAINFGRDMRACVSRFTSDQGTTCIKVDSFTRASDSRVGGGRIIAS